jgi:A/G-specific adenine glycosylase
VRNGRLDPEHVAAVQQRVLAWYAQNARDLPWRRTRDPYAILVAEIMLQQTQVDRVIPHWLAWLDRFPTLRDLAAATRADVIRAWKGLGYNLRAVRLHALATQCVAEHGGELPRTLDGLLKLDGVGRYTAGAVACFAYELPVSMVDTNVRRVVSRVFADPLRTDDVADAVMPRSAAYAWNQAVMDLGATLCRAERPLCLVCPLLDVCRASQSGIPARPSKRSSPPAFHGSSRYVRGRIIDRLRALPDGAGLAVAELAGDFPGAERLVVELARDGLLRLEDGYACLA